MQPPEHVIVASIPEFNEPKPGPMLQVSVLQSRLLPQGMML